MSYVPPRVRIYQEYVTPAPVLIEPDLPALIVGPLYRIGTKEGAIPSKYEGSSIETSPANLEASDVLKGDSVHVYINNSADGEIYEIDDTHYTVNTTTQKITIDADLELEFSNYTSKTGTVDSDHYTLEYAAGTFKTDHILIGDKISLDDGATTLSTTIAGIPDETHVILKDEWTGNASTSFTITRALLGDILISYKALRTDLAGTIYSYENYNHIVGNLGNVTPNNPLGYALTKAMANSYGEPVYGLSIPTDDQNGHLQVIDAIDRHETVYAITPLFFINDKNYTTAVGSYISTVTAKSDPDRSEFCILNFSAEYLPDEENYEDETSVSISVVANSNKFTDSSAHFADDGVEAEDYLEVRAAADDTVVGKYKILAVLDNNNLLLASKWAVSTTVTSYRVYRAYNRDAKAKNLKLLGQSYQNRRVRIQIPQYVEDGDDLVEGYYISAAVSGQDSGVNPAQPTTNFPLYGFSRIRFSNGYFSSTQLNVIAEGGIEIFIQKTPGAPLLSRHQMTTDTTSVTKREKSIVRAVDWFSRFLVKSVSPFIGRNNITKLFLDMLSFIINAAINYAVKVKKVANAGTKLTQLAQDPELLDNVNVYIDYDPLYPANYINIHILI